MDFFEKAHVVKRETSRKGHKYEEAVKKQLKRMLTGFKKHDSKLIKIYDDAFDPNKMLDESSSVSGFSDVNLSNSSNEANTTKGSESDDNIQSDVDDASHSEAHFSKNNSSDTTSSVNLDLSKESISEYDDNIQSLSDNISVHDSLNSCSDASNVISVESSSDESNTESHETEFDADGALANKILKKLQIKGVIKKKGKKRKLDVKSENIVDCFLADKQKYREASETEDIDNVSSASSQSSNKVKNESIENIVSDTNSSEFVSIAPTEIPTQSLADIIGEYKYSTVRNIPDAQNLHACNAGTFSLENVVIDEIEFQDSSSYSFDNYNKDSIESDEMNEITDLVASQDPASASTDVYDDTLQSDDTSEKDISDDLIDTHFKSPTKVYYGNSNCIFLLKDLSELYIHGKVIVTALHGNIEILGYTLKSEACEVYAPNYNYAFCLKPIATDHDSAGLFNKLKSLGLSVADAEEIVTELEQFDVVIRLKRLSNHKLDFVENNMTQTDLFSKTNKQVENCFKKASEMLGCSLYLTKPYKVFEELSCWKQVMNLGFENQSRGIICGGKGVGKSTFLRCCVNRLLAKGPVLVVDLDPGQAEFTVAGNISATVVDKPLLGPGFTHLQTPNMMLNIGMINTMDNPRRYSSAVATLIAHCDSDEQLKSMPWVVNTMGMCNAMGLKFITQAILQTQPTYLLQINTKNPKKNFETLLNPDNVKKLYEENFHYDSLFRYLTLPEYLDYSFFLENHGDSSPKKNSSLAPRDERYLNFLAYFSELLNSRQVNGLLGIRPYEVNLGDLRIGLNIKINYDAIAKVINGKIIALCQLPPLDNTGKVFTLKDKPLLCHGHGLIRGIDFGKEILYVVTPTPGDKLALVDTLVYADWVPELRGQERALPDGVTIPYRAVTLYQKRQLTFTPRRRFNPLQLLKMSRNT